MRKIIIKRLIILSAIAGVISGMVLLIGKGCSSDSGMEYVYERVVPGDVIKSISATGKLDLFETVTVYSEINGTVSKLLTDYNKYVSAGDLLAVLDSEDVDRNLASFSETFKRAQLDLESAKEVFESKKQLRAEELISPKEVDEARRTYERNVTLYNQTKISYDNLVGAVKAKKVYSPSSGIVLQRGVDEKQVIAPKTILFVIAPNMKKMKLIINVDESDVGFVKAGLSVSFTVSAYPDKIFSGKITQVRMNPVLLSAGGGAGGSKIVTYESLVQCENNEMFLRPGMTVSAMINIDTKKDVLRVSNGSFMISPVPVQNTMGKKFVWKKSKLSVQSIPMDRIEVKTGLTGDDYTEIISGNLKAGDEILIGMHKKFDLKVPDAK